MGDITGKTYQGSVANFAASFNATKTAPLDDRLVVNSITALTDGSISSPYKGMVVNIAGTPDLYVFIGGSVEESKNIQNWKKASGGSGLSKYSIPIMTESMRQLAIEDSDIDFGESDNYIGIETDYESIEGETNTNTVTTQNGTYIEILFSAIRSLQAEVNRLKNTFKYGINSYNEDDTALSAISGGDMGDNDDDEPIWAIDPDDVAELSEITRINEDSLKRFSKIASGNNVFFTEQNSQEKITITSSGSTFKLTDSEVKAIKAVTDTKLLLYFQVACNKSGDNYVLPEISINLNSLENQTETEEDNNIKFRPFSLLGENVQGGLRPEYNVMVIVSRKQENKDVTDPNDKFTGKNYIYCSISDKRTDEVIIRGYWNRENDVLYDRVHLSDIEERYFWDEIYFKDLTITGCRFCSKYQDFSNEVIPENPDNKNDFKYEAAHITIRAISTKEKAVKIKDQLQENELIWVKDEGIMLIKSDGRLRVVTSGKNSNVTEDSDNEDIENMTTQELLEKLMSMGIIVNTKSDGTDSDSDPDFDFLEFNDVASITFINQDTDRRYKFTVNPYGQLQSTEVLENDLQKLIDDYNKDKTADKKFVEDTACENYRGFIAKLRSSDVNAASDLGDNNDRLRISSFFVPLKSAKKCGCSHSYIELENSSTKDIPLKGMILYHKYFNGSNWVIRKLPLEGICKAGSTYLVRGAQHADLNSPSTFIKVTEFDQEWWEEINGKKQLVSFELDNTVTTENQTQLAGNIHSFFITYGEISGLRVDTTLITANTASNKTDFPYIIKNTSYVEGCAYIPKTFIKGEGVADTLTAFPSSGKTMNSAPSPEKGIINITENSIFRLMFKLDPAKQAFNGFSLKDSSRERYKNTTDIFVVNLDNPAITFKTSPYEYPIERYTPHASSYNATVMTDKTRLDFDKPNMVNVAFGIDVYKTRCFSWVSVGSFDEYVWIRESGEQNWTRFESYKPGDGIEAKNSITKKTFNNVLKTAAYDRIFAKFPGDYTPFTAHKCILDFVYVTTPTTYEYRVGRGCGFGNNTLDENHCSEIRTFVLYPQSWEGRVYQITDQQGFHWVEYQAWAGAAKAIHEKIINDNLPSTHEFPIIINTGDMTQSGARINEWLDYHMAGDILFREFEQMNVVGNNDLNDINPEVLGTGNDSGKSVSRFFHYFYCHEVPDDQSLVMGPDLKYIPSIYYFNTKNIMYLCFNSEITTTTSNKWLKLNYIPNVTLNPYTGIAALTVAGTSTVADTTNFQNAIVDRETAESLHFTPIYKTIYNWLMINKLQSSPKSVIFACHEIPFTVITVDSLQTSKTLNYTKDTRNYPSGSSLLGSHANQMNKSETRGIFWLSRLFEHFGVRLAIGGHKHTYAISFPLQEFYIYNTPELTGYLLYDSVNEVYNAISEEVARETEYFSRIVDITLSDDDFAESADLNFKIDGTAITGNLVDSYFISNTIQLTKYCGGELGKTFDYIEKFFKGCVGYKLLRYTKYSSNPEKQVTSKPSTVPNTNGGNLPNYGQMFMTWNQMENEATTTLIPSDNTIDYKAKTPKIDVKWQVNISKDASTKGMSELGDVYCLDGENSGEEFILNTTKLPLMYNENNRFSNVQDSTAFKNGLFRCVTPIEKKLPNPVVYFMLQATGYKITSNKELPSEFQYFSNILPKTTNTVKEVDGKPGEYTVSSTANGNQCYPMYAMIKINSDANGNIGADLYMTRIKGIYKTDFAGAKITMTQGTKPSQDKFSYEYLIPVSDNCYGNWSETVYADEGQTKVGTSTSIDGTTGTDNSGLNVDYGNSKIKMTSVYFPSYNII